MDPSAGMEPGSRASEFWKWSVDRERKAAERWRRKGALRRNQSSPTFQHAAGGLAPKSVADPIHDHGLIYPCLHDTLRPRPQEAPAPKPSPYAGWHGPQNYDDSVESAVTMMTSMVSASAPRPSSLLSTSRPLQAAARCAVESCVSASSAAPEQPMPSRQRNKDPNAAFADLPGCALLTLGLKPWKGAA